MKTNWVLLSVIALSSFSIMSFLITSLTRKGYPVSFVLLGIGIILTISYSVQTFVIEKYKPELTVGITLLILLIGMLSAVGNFTSYQAANSAPNPGLAIAISGMSAGVVALLAFFFLKTGITTMQVIGLVLALVSVFFITAGRKITPTDKVPTSIIGQDNST
ncbi:MAG: hypothetical protein AAB590_02685 [Patescibacteria group bacterium]|mgnify:CR=1 FL=1